MLSNEQKRKLRQIAHNEKPVVYIGKNGMTETVLDSFDDALYAHNLVKVSLQKSSPLSAKEAADIFVEEFECEVVSIVGRVIVLYRYHKKGRVIV
ncbi:MAG TPA: YhbY family RNA-binding protein [Erysipelothrix sp.]|nr:YhbY family RNA-binding protein [Erysipelothrix sp.]